MNWIEQVGHVFVKDVRESWRAFALYAVVVLIATLQGLGWRLLDAAVVQGMMILVVAVGLFIAATVVQGDSPTRSDAFWASHPFHPSAVLGAKLAVALLLVLIALLGQLIAVASYDLHGGELLQSLIRPAAIYCVWLIAAMTIAALLRDLRSFALAMIGIPIAAFLAFLLVISRLTGTHELSPLLATVGAVFGAVLGLFMLTWLYRMRDGRRGTRVMGFIVASTALLAIFSGPLDAYSPDVPSGAAPVALELERVPVGPDTLGLSTSARVALENVNRDGGDAAPVAIAVLRVPRYADDLEVALVEARMVVHLRDGSRFTRPLVETLLNLRSGGSEATSPMPGVRWLRGTPGTRLFTASERETQFVLGVALTHEERSRIDANAIGMALEGRMVVRRSSHLATLPLATGSEVTEAGRRFGVERWERARPSLLVWMRSLRRPIATSNDRMWNWGNDITYALVNPVAHEAIALHRYSSNSGLSGLVLPGAWFRAETVRLEPVRGVAVGDAWYQDARLAISTQVPLGSYPVHVEVATP